MELQYVGRNSLILTNSNALFQILKPEKISKIFEKKKFVFPEKKHFKFFSSEKMLLSTTYQEAYDAFENNLFGFYGASSLESPQTCLSETLDMEALLKDITFQGPIFLVVVNQKSQIPLETKFIKTSKPPQHFNYLDVCDPLNTLFTKHIISEMLTFIKQSVLVSVYFGSVEEKNIETYLDPLKNIAPLIIGLKNDDGMSSLAQFDLFIQFNSYSYALYFTPLPVELGVWKDISFFNNFYPPSLEVDRQNVIEIFPNVKPFPAYGGSIFSKPYFLKTLNFGTKNFLDICAKRPGFLDYAGDTRGTMSLLSVLKYSTSSGISNYAHFILLFV